MKLNPSHFTVEMATSRCHVQQQQQIWSL